MNDFRIETEDPEENMSDSKKPNLSSLLKNGHLRMTLELRLRMGKFSLLYANQFSQVECNDFMQEAKSRNIEGSAFYTHLSKNICPSFVIQTSCVIISLVTVSNPVVEIASAPMWFCFHHCGIH